MVTALPSTPHQPEHIRDYELKTPRRKVSWKMEKEGERIATREENGKDYWEIANYEGLVCRALCSSFLPWLVPICHKHLISWPDCRAMHCSTPAHTPQTIKKLLVFIDHRAACLDIQIPLKTPRVRRIVSCHRISSRLAAGIASETRLAVCSSRTGCPPRISQACTRCIPRWRTTSSYRSPCP